ncbi:unnamed protein product, partial [Phaeothamnion confervicola]
RSGIGRDLGRPGFQVRQQRNLSCFCPITCLFPGIGLSSLSAFSDCFALHVRSFISCSSWMSDKKVDAARETFWTGTGSQTLPLFSRFVHLISFPSRRLPFL